MKTTCTIRCELPNVVREETLRKAAFRLARFEGFVKSVRITISDVNGPRGGQGIECLVRTKLEGLPELVVIERSESAGRAANSALERTSRAVARASRKRTSRLQYQRRRGAQTPAEE